MNPSLKIKFVFKPKNEIWYETVIFGSAENINLTLKYFISRFGDLCLFAEGINLTTAEYLKIINSDEFDCKVVINLTDEL